MASPNVAGILTGVGGVVAAIDPQLGDALGQDAAQVAAGAVAFGRAASPQQFSLGTVGALLGISSGGVILLAALILLALYFALRGA